VTCQTERSFRRPFMDKLSRNPVQLAHNRDDLLRIQERAIRQPDRTGVLRHARTIGGSRFGHYMWMVGRVRSQRARVENVRDPIAWARRRSGDKTTLSNVGGRD
jgi:hypothetical protein